MQKNISEYKLVLNKLKASVFGYYPRIAKKANVSVVTVSQVLNGAWVNKKVLRAAKRVQVELEKEKQELTKFIS